MTRRSRWYFSRKRYAKWVKTPVGEMMSKIHEDLCWYGMCGTKTSFEDGQVKVRRLTYAELLDMQARSSRGETIPDEYCLGGDELVTPEMKQRIDELRQQYPNL